MEIVLAMLACAAAVSIGFFWGRTDAIEAENARHAERLAKYNAIRKLLAEHASFVADEYNSHARGRRSGKDVAILVMSARSLESDAREALSGLD